MIKNVFWENHIFTRFNLHILQYLTVILLEFTKSWHPNDARTVICKVYIHRQLDSFCFTPWRRARRGWSVWRSPPPWHGTRSAPSYWTHATLSTTDAWWSIIYNKSQPDVLTIRWSSALAILAPFCLEGLYLLRPKTEIDENEGLKDYGANCNLIHLYVGIYNSLINFFQFNLWKCISMGVAGNVSSNF